MRAVLDLAGYRLHALGSDAAGKLLVETHHGLAEGRLQRLRARPGVRPEILARVARAVPGQVEVRAVDDPGIERDHRVGDLERRGGDVADGRPLRVPPHVAVGAPQDERGVRAFEEASEVGLLRDRGSQREQQDKEEDSHGRTIC